MKKLQFITVLSVVLFLISCGLSEQEKRIAQQRHDDSVKQVAAQFQLKRDQASIDMQADKEKLNLQIANLAEAKQAMADIQDFHFLRTDEEKEEQVKNQTLKIEAINDSINQIQIRINNETTILNQRM
jgi:hypothetical protein